MDMDNTKKVFLSKEAQTQRVEIYLKDLKNRLMEMREQQENIVKSSLNIIKEIDRVSIKLTWDQNSNDVSDDNISKIQKLIQEFEATHKEKYHCKPNLGNTNKDTILEKFESEKQSLVSDNVRNKISKFPSDVPTTSKKVDGNLININGSMQTEKLSSGKITEQDCFSNYVSCCSSLISLQKLKANSNYLTGSDSECDLKITDK